MYIDDDQRGQSAQFPGIETKEIAPAKTAGGQTLRVFEYTPPATGNWEHVSYGEEGDFYIVFTVSSRSRQGLDNALETYEKIVSGYR